jgi:hypothetical protein
MKTFAQLLHIPLALLDGVSFISLVVGVAKAFAWFDGMLNDSGRKVLGRYLNNLPPDDRIDSWGTVFPALIDRVFGTRPFSLGFFLRSCLASIVAVTITSLVIYRFFRGYGPSIYLVESIYVILLYSFVLAIIASLIPDYFSLLISRAIVRLMARKLTSLRIGAFLLLDIIVTIFLAELGILCLSVVFPTVQGLWLHQSLTEGKYVFDHLFSFRQACKMMLGFADTTFYHQYVVIYFFSAFFTSFWVWLYISSIAVIKLLHGIRYVWLKLTPYLDVDGHPLTTIGKVAGLLVGTGYALLVGTAWAVNSSGLMKPYVSNEVRKVEVVNVNTVIPSVPGDNLMAQINVLVISQKEWPLKKYSVAAVGPYYQDASKQTEVEEELWKKVLDLKAASHDPPVPPELNKPISWEITLHSVPPADWAGVYFRRERYYFVGQITTADGNGLLDICFNVDARGVPESCKSHGRTLFFTDDSVILPPVQ